ncbi:hypothetical protein DFH06DRAFT_1153061 [Mycena polygramma]|nr:hypothetical protein DFH06DRAFT_1153061 [Mycena polygramma]
MVEIIPDTNPHGSLLPRHFALLGRTELRPNAGQIMAHRLKDVPTELGHEWVLSVGSDFLDGGIFAVQELVAKKERLGSRQGIAERRRRRHWITGQRRSRNRTCGREYYAHQSNVAGSFFRDKVDFVKQRAEGPVPPVLGELGIATDRAIIGHGLQMHLRDAGPDNGDKLSIGGRIGETAEQGKNNDEHIRRTTRNAEMCLLGGDFGRRKTLAKRQRRMERYRHAATLH